MLGYKFDCRPVLWLAVLPLFGCVTRSRMCVAPAECGARAACVAGRCQRAGIAAIQSTVRLISEPVAMAYVRRGDGATDGALPATFSLGRDADGDARLFLRFSVPLAHGATIVEAYVVLERSSALDADPVPIALHAARVVDPWDPRSISWGSQPRIEETRSPSTRVTSAGRALVRVDVRDLVVRWRAHDRADQGLVIVAENSTRTGLAFAFAPSGTEGASLATEMELGASPRLELYVK